MCVSLGVPEPQTAQGKRPVTEFLFTAVTVPEGENMQSGLPAVLKTRFGGFSSFKIYVKYLGNNSSEKKDLNAVVLKYFGGL